MLSQSYRSPKGVPPGAQVVLLPVQTIRLVDPPQTFLMMNRHEYPIFR